MRLFLFGYGKMGKLVGSIAQERGHQIVRSLDQADVALDFSFAKGVLGHVKEACTQNLPIVIGTTGWEPDLPEARALIEKSKTAALYAPNFSIGVALFRKLLKQAAPLFSEYGCAGVEWHHEEKKDAPSGTAKALAKELKLVSPFASVRCGSIVGKHQVVFDSPVESITLTHEAKNREGFAQGALRAAEWIVNKQGWFSLDDMLHSVDHSLQS